MTMIKHSDVVLIVIVYHIIMDISGSGNHLMFINYSGSIHLEDTMRKLSQLCTFLTMILLLVICCCPETGGSNKVPKAFAAPVDAEARLKELGIRLSPPPAPIANYVNSVRSGNLVFLAGHGPLKADGTWMQGKVGRDIDIEEGKKAPRLTGINMLSSLKAEIGDLNKVTRVVKVLGMVNSDESFTDQPKVMNGFSDLMVSVFGENGRHARAAVGMAQLPFGIPIEIEMIVEDED